MERIKAIRAWGHSIIADPFGRVISEMDEEEGLRITELSLPLAEEIRRQIPLRAKDFH